MSRAPAQTGAAGGSRKISFNVSEQYDIQDVVGEGAYGVVCSALHKPSGQKVAIKKINPMEHSMFLVSTPLLACGAFGVIGHIRLSWEEVRPSFALPEEPSTPGRHSPSFDQNNH